MSVPERFVFGRWEPGGPLSAADAGRICAEAETRREALARYPLDKTLRLLDRVRALWARPDYPPRAEAERALPAATGFSPEMIRLGLAELQSILDPEPLRRKLATESSPARYDPATRTELRWEPLGTLLHVLSGNVFLVGPGSLVEGLLTRNVTILKLPSGEGVFLPPFMRSLAECDEDGVVSRSLAAVSFPSEDRGIIAEFQRRVDGVVVWGGEGAVRAYRDGLPARARLVVFGPKLSLAVVTRAGAARAGLERTARELAEQIAIWDQNACTAPQLCYLEGEELAQALLDPLARALQELARELPAGTPGLDTAAEIRKLRSVFEIAGFRGEGALRESPEGVGWTVLLDRDTALEPSPLHRTLRLVPVRELDEIVPRLRELRGSVQTVGLAAEPAEHARLAALFGAEGALRVVPICGMAGGEIDDPHDGRYDLPQLMNRVVVRYGPELGELRPAELAEEGERAGDIDAALRALVDRARALPFYRARLGERRVESARDLNALPLLSRAEAERSLRPKDMGVARGGYVTRSGGSTGPARFTYFDASDWAALVEAAAEAFLACGLRPGDRVANCMLAGDLYGSFVSFNAVNERLGLTSFAFAGKATAEALAETWRDFGINAAQGVPASLVPLLRQTKSLEPAFALETVLYAGQPMSARDRAWLGEALGATRICSVIGATETGLLAFQCGRLEGGLHHLAEGYALVELVDAEGRPVPDGEIGALAVTTLRKLNAPLLRFLIGDKGRFVTRGCACGRRGRLLDYLGRSDDILCIGQMNIEFGDLARALEGLPVSDIQLVAQARAGGDWLTVKLEAEGDPAELRNRALDALQDSVHELRDCVRAGWLTLGVEVHAPGTLPRNPRTGKLKAVVDERR